MYTLIDTYTDMTYQRDTLTDVADTLPALFAGTPVEPQALAYADLLRTGHTNEAYNAYLGLALRKVEQ